MKTANELASYYFETIKKGCKPDRVHAFKYEACDWANKVAMFLYKYDISQVNGYASEWDYCHYSELLKFVENAFKHWKNNNSFMVDFIGKEWMDWNDIED